MEKTIFGVILAAFLLMSVSFIAPVYVQAAEINIKQTKKNIGELTTSITEHKEFEDILNNPDLAKIVESILESGATEKKVTDYWNTIKNLDSFEKICTEEITNKAEKIQNSIDKILSTKYDDEDQDEDGFYLTIDENNILSISQESKENSIFLDSDGSIELSGHETINPDIMQKIKDFLIILFLIGLGAAVGVLIIAGVFFLLQTIIAAIATGLGTLVTVIVGVAIVFAGIAGVSAAITFIIDVIEFLTKSEDTKNKTKTENVKSMKTLVRTFISKIFSLLNMKIQHVFF